MTRLKEKQEEQDTEEGGVKIYHLLLVHLEK